MAVLYTPSQFLKGAKSLFIQSLASQGPFLLSEIATVVPSGSNKETYTWLGESPQLEVENEGDPLPIGSLTDTSYDLTNLKYWKGLEVKRDNLNDDQVGGIPIRIRQLAQVANRKAGALEIAALISGTTDLCYDGVALFSDSHPARKDEGGVQDNLLAGTGTSTAAVGTDINSVITKLATILAENGEPHNEVFTELWIVAPPAMRRAFREALLAGIISNTTNVAFSDINVFTHFSARLSAADDWYAGIRDTNPRALLWQDREPVTFEALEGGNDQEFYREIYAYKARMRGIPGYGKWQVAAKVAN
jgi:phage major head subunit gpT-like protein